MNAGVISLGCAKNLVDTERMLGSLTACGFHITNDAADADVLIVNTCGFITPAKEESIQTILEMAAYKRTGKCRLLIATGCLTQRYRQELALEMPEIDIILGVNEYEKLPALLAERLHTPVCGAACPRVLATPPHRAYLRIGDGCNNRCAYCAIPLIRGPLASEPVETLLDEARRLADTGVKELTVVAQDTSGYGRDRYGEPRLIPLLRELDRIPGLRWVRVLYTYPDTVNRALLDTLSAGERLVPYLDIPLQHASDAMLSRMRRRGTKQHISDILEHVEKYYPDMTLRTTMMVGFPGETEQDFLELMQFLREHPFDRVGAFAFSPEEGTPAADMPGQIPEEVKQARLSALMRQQQDISLERNRRAVGRTCDLLIEQLDGTAARGRTMREAPDADGLVTVGRTPDMQTGMFVPIRLTEASCYDMIGERI